MLTRLTRQFKFSRSLDVGLKLHYQDGVSKLFMINSAMTINDFNKLVFSEDQDKFLSMKLILGDKDYANEDMKFLDFLIHNPVKIQIDGINYAYELDGCSPANYVFDASDFETQLSKLEIPFQDSYVIIKFYSQLIANLTKNQQIKPPFTKEQVAIGIEETLTKFGQKNQPTAQYWTLYQQVLEQSKADLAEKEEQVQAVKEESQNEGNKLLKKWIAIAGAQYVFLLVLTYGIYSWNVSEPISYLLAQGLETLGIFYFLRRGFAFRQSNLYSMKFKEVFNQKINSKYNSTNFQREVAFAKTRVNMAENKILYGTTSH